MLVPASGLDTPLVLAGAGLWLQAVTIDTVVTVEIDSISNFRRRSVAGLPGYRHPQLEALRTLIADNKVYLSVPPYWVPYGDRAYFVSKNCETQSACKQKKLLMNPSCKRDWFDDWGCIECCTGDLCNYYVTCGNVDMTVVTVWCSDSSSSEIGPIAKLGAGTTRVSWLTFLTTLCVTCALQRVL